MDIPYRLKSRRQRVDMTIGGVAEALGVSYQYVRQLEEGVNRPSTWPLLAKMAAIYGTSADYILGLTDDPAPAEQRSLPAHAAELLEIARSLSDERRAELAAIATLMLQRDSEEFQNE